MTLRDFRPADPSELESVLRLREQVFPGLDLPRERRRWQWEFDENPCSIDAVPASWVLVQKERIVGNYGLLPCRVFIDGEPVQAFSGIDFAIDPKLQGKGLGHLIAERFMDPAFCAFPFITSPTPATCHLMQKYGGSVLVGAGEPCLWVLPLDRVRDRSRPDAGADLRPIASFDRRHDELALRLSRLSRIQTVRDAAYLNWRYRDYPFGRPVMVEAVSGAGALHGFAVFQYDPNLRQGYLLELFIDPREARPATALIEHAIRAAAEAGANELYTLNRVPGIQELLRAAGFQRVDTHPLQFVCRPPGGGPAAADWYLTSGDGDLLFGVGDLPA